MRLKLKDTISAKKPRLSGPWVLPVLAVSAGLALSAGAVETGVASAETINTEHGVSRNWSGYVVQNKSGQGYTAASGSWNVPSVTSKIGYGYSADWVGIGGATQNSKALEQVGTSSDVVNGQPQYSAWYEVVPAPTTTLHLTVHPGDHMYGRVTVHGHTVTMTLSDQTTGHTVSKTEHPRQVDTSSAEWIEEAPSMRVPSGRDRVLPLADFGKATFANAYATSGGKVGAISDPDWTTDAVHLSTSATFTFPGTSAGALTVPGITITLPGSGTAHPGELSNEGSSFSVTYHPTVSTTPTTTSAPRCLLVPRISLASSYRYPS